MNSRVTRAKLLMVLSICLVIASCQKQIKGDEVTPVGAPSPVELRFKHVVTQFKDLILDSTYYTPGLPPTPFKITEFKYYISNIELISADGDTVAIPDTYFLVDHRKPESMNALFTAPAGDYYSLSFLIGIDHERNMNGPRTGALDPSLGMFWDNTDGYIMAKLEGTAPSSPLPGDVFEYNVGGTKDPFNVLSRRYFKLGGNAMVTPNKKTVINLNTDVLTWFNNPYTLVFANEPFSDAPGQLSKDISSNYYKMFSFVSVKYE
jgi:hypothetical protein